MNIFHKLKSSLMYREAVRKADRAHADDGRRYYVLPSAEGKLLIMDRENFRILKHKHYIDSRARVQDLVDECFYCTPYRNGDGALPPEQQAIKRKQYFSWYRAFSRLKKLKNR
jgi:hypothetical protein